MLGYTGACTFSLPVFEYQLNREPSPWSACLQDYKEYQRTVGQAAPAAAAGSGAGQARVASR